MHFPSISNPPQHLFCLKKNSLQVNSDLPLQQMVKKGMMPRLVTIKLIRN